MTVLVKLLVMTVLVTKNESLGVLCDRQFQVVIFLLIILVRTTQQLLFQCFVFSNKLVNFLSNLHNFCLGVCLWLGCCPLRFVGAAAAGGVRVVAAAAIGGVRAVFLMTSLPKRL